MEHTQGRYYLGRVKKVGNLDDDKIVAAILNPRPLRLGKFDWTFTDVQKGVLPGPGAIPYVFGNLSKYQAEGLITVVDRSSKQQAATLIPDLLIASAPFVYLRTFSGIAHLHVWNEIQHDLFARRFASIVESTYDNFFVECSVEPISDYRLFSAKIEELDTINELNARVHPPNPLFGRYWKPLRDYLKRRNASEVAIQESSKTEHGLRTQVVELMKKATEEPTAPLPEAEAPIGDASILMAADGYGTAKIVGKKNSEKVVVRTADTQETFEFTKSPEPQALANQASKHFRRISNNRNLRH